MGSFSPFRDFPPWGVRGVLSWLLAIGLWLLVKVTSGLRLGCESLTSGFPLASDWEPNGNPLGFFGFFLGLPPSFPFVAFLSLIAAYSAISESHLVCLQTSPLL